MRHVKRTVLLIVVASVSTTYAFSGGDGSEADPYQISTVADWQELMATSTDWGSYFRLTWDIDLAGVTVTPVGNYSRRFTGVFDGNGHVLRNATIDMSGHYYAGLFGYLGSGGQIRDLGVKSVDITGDRYVGGLVGYNLYGMITACYAAGLVTGTDNYVGGLVGSNVYGTIIDCYATGLVDGNSFTGGLVGCNDSGTITACYARGSVSGDSSVGGLVGYNPGTITTCYARGSIRGNVSVGGLVGRNDSSGTITACYAAGVVRSYLGNVGGLVGWNKPSGTITACYAACIVSGSDRVGGLVGHNSQGKIIHCYSTGQPMGIAKVGGLCGLKDIGGDYEDTGNFWDTDTSQTTVSAMGTGKTTALMKDINTFLAAGWNISATGGDPADWWMPSNDYPRSAWEWGSYSGGSGTEADPYQISTFTDWQELMGISTDWDKRFKLTNDIDFGGITLMPVAPDNSITDEFQGTPFIGVFDGNGHVLRNATIDMSGTDGQDYVGLFGYLGSGGLIRNLGIESVNVTGRCYVGGLVGESYDGIISQCYVTGDVNGYYSIGGLCALNYYGEIITCYTIGIVSGSSTQDSGPHLGVGGLCGYNWNGMIRDCHATGDVSGHYFIGGLCGRNRYEGTIMSSYTTGDVSGDSFVGGLCGANYGTTTSCYASGLVTGTDVIGGLCGWNYQSTTRSCYATGAVTGVTAVGGLVGTNSQGKIIHCYSIGKPTGTSDVGGLCGSKGIGGGYEDTGNFWDTNTSQTTTSAMGIGKTTVQMQDINTFLAAEWDFSTVDGDPADWWMPSNDYPRLAWVFYSGGSGTEADPYQISTVADWQELMASPADWESHFLLTEDIDLTGLTITPVGHSNTHFTGVFNGNGHVIHNATINLPTSYYVGLFGFAGSSGQIKDLCVENAQITGQICVGCLCGRNDGTIDQCYATGTVTGDSNVGGLCGWNGGTISQCSSGAVTGGTDSVGGLCGSNYSTISQCFATSAVTGEYFFIGGLCGWNGGTINQCYVTGAVTGGTDSDSVGGLCGSNYGTISQCYATGEVAGEYYVGGLVGYDYDTISQCYFLHPADGGGQINGFGTPLTDAQMRQQDSFVGWDFVDDTSDGDEDIWAMPADGGYPVLSWQGGYMFVNLAGEYGITLLDYAAIAAAWQATNGEPHWNAKCDINGNGIIDLPDLCILLDHWLLDIP